MNTLCDSAGVW